MSKVEFREPQSEGEAAGYLTDKRVKSPYELFMEEEGIPIFRGIGVRDTRELTLPGSAPVARAASSTCAATDAKSVSGVVKPVSG